MGLGDVAAAEMPAWAEGLFAGHRFASIRGGRGGAKSWTVARALVIRAAQKKLRVLCAREFQNSIQDSVHKLLDEQIDELGLACIYEVQQASIRCTLTGSEFIFSGLRSNIASIKSKEGIDVAWCEEAQTISHDSWATLIPTIRKEGSEIIATWNPLDDDDPTYQRFVVNPPPDCWSIIVNWDQNPWFPDVLRREKDYLFSVDPEAAEHIWNGATRRMSDAQVLRGRYIVESFKPVTSPEGAAWSGPLYGADWGFAVDPTTLIRCWIHGRTLYVEHEAYGVGVDLDDTPALFERVPGSRKHTIRADSSRLETISRMRRHGFQMLGAAKGPGSVEDGVEHLRSYEKIVIHPRCERTAEEARLWSYKVDRLTGDVKPELADKHDHCWDAIRYGLEPIIQRGKPKAKGKKPEPKRHDYEDRKPVGSERWKTV